MTPWKFEFDWSIPVGGVKIATTSSDPSPKTPLYTNDSLHSPWSNSLFPPCLDLSPRLAQTLLKLLFCSLSCQFIQVLSIISVQVKCYWIATHAPKKVFLQVCDLAPATSGNIWKPFRATLYIYTISHEHLSRCKPLVLLALRTIWFEFCRPGGRAKEVSFWPEPAWG